MAALDRLYAFLAAQGESTEQVEAAAQAVAKGIERWAKNAPEEARKPLALAWHNALPAPHLTLIWRTARVVVDRLRVNLAEDEAERAEALSNLSVTLSEVGRREEALAAAEEAVAIRRRLAEQNPQAYEPYLAMSLNNLARSLAEMGRREEALSAAEEAVAIRRRLAKQNPQAYEPDLALSLTALAAVLSYMGRREEALAAAEKAAGLYRRLAEQNPQAYEPDLALSLNNLAAMLSDLGRRKEALAAAEEAAGLYRRLAEQNPQAYAPDLARSLGALGSVLLGMERASEAAEAFAEGLRVLLPHARRLPQAFGSLLQSLLNDHLRAAQAAGQPPDENLAVQALAVGAQGPAPLPPALWQWVEEAARTDKPLDTPIAQMLQAVSQAENVPPQRCTLAARLYAVLEGNRDPNALTAGLPLDEAVNMLVLLASVEKEDGGRIMVLLAQALAGFLNGDEQARQTLEQFRDFSLQHEEESVQAFGNALQALLSGERDPDRLLSGWGEDNPLFAALFRLFLAHPQNPA